MAIWVLVAVVAACGLATCVLLRRAVRRPLTDREQSAEIVIAVVCISAWIASFWLG